jgi:hypothetical protein
MAMSVLDALKVETERRRGPAGPPPRWSPAGDSEPPEAPDSPAAPESPAQVPEAPLDHRAYCRYWVAQLQRLLERPVAQQATQMDRALAGAPPEHRPPPADALLLQVAGRALPVEEVLGWLRLRAELPAGADALDPVVAAYWLRHLDLSHAAVGTPAWAAHCRQTALGARLQGKALDPAVLAAVQAHPEWARGYLRCGGSKARVLAGLQPPVAEPDAAERSAADASALPPPLSGAPGAPMSLPQPPAPAGALAFGGAIGAVLGGALRTVTAVAATAAGATKNAVQQTPGWFKARRVHLQIQAQARAAEQALTELAAAASRLRQHPALQDFWTQVDRHAARGGQDRTTIFQAMANPLPGNLGIPSESLDQQLTQLLRADPALAAHLDRAYQAYDRLSVAWERCAGAFREAGERWTPSPTQVRRLNAACLDIPPLPDRSVAAEAAERLVRSLAQLAQAVRETFRPAPPAASPSPPAA